MDTTTKERIVDIETYMGDLRNLFVKVFSEMMKRQPGKKNMPSRMSQLKALSAFQEDREYTMGELSKKVMVKMPSMTEMVDRLESEGIVDRIRDTGDRRVVKVRLTEKGKKVYRDFIERRRKEMGAILALLSDEDQVELVKGLEKVSSVLKKIPS